MTRSARLNGRHRHSFWSEIYEASLAVPLLPVTLLTLWDPRKGKYNVTDKGGMVEDRTDRFANVHVPIGKVSFSGAQLAENLQAFLETVMKSKPSMTSSPRMRL